MGFYGNATYYLPNGIAQDVVNGVITIEKMADNSIGTDQIINENITEEKLANTFWRYEYFWYDDKNVDKDFIQQLDDFVSDKTRKNCNNQILAFNLDYAVKISDDVILSAGTYIGWKQRHWKSYYLNNVKTNEYWSFNGAAKTIQKIKIDTDDIALNTITGGSKEGEGNIAEGTIQGYNIDTNTIKGSYKAPGEDDMSGSHLGEYTIGRTNLGNKIITASKVADTAIHGKGNESEWQHIANESIAGDEGGDIAQNTITGYNIKDGSIGPQELQEKYLLFESYSSANSLSTLQSHLINLSENSKILVTNIIIENDLGDDEEESIEVILSKGFWTFIKSETRIVNQGKKYCAWLAINFSSLEQYLIELQYEPNSLTLLNFDILKTQTTLTHNYSDTLIQSWNDWLKFLSSKNYKNHNFICNLKFSLKDKQNEELFVLYQNDTDKVQVNDKEIILSGNYLGFWFNDNIDGFYLMDENGALIRYSSDPDDPKFILLSSLYIIDHLPENSIGLDKLQKPCLYIEDLGTLGDLGDLTQILKNIELSTDSPNSTVFAFALEQGAEGLIKNMNYYAIPLMQNGINQYWQISTTLLPFTDLYQLKIDPHSQQGSVTKQKIKSADIEQGSVYGSAIENSTSLIYPYSIDARDIAEQGIGAREIVDGSLYGCGNESKKPSKFKPFTIGAGDIATNAIENRHLSPGCVSGSADGNESTIQHGSIGNNELSEKSIQHWNLHDLCVYGSIHSEIESTHIVPNSIGANDIHDRSITTRKIAQNAVGPNEIALGAITKDHIENNAIRYNHIQEGAVRTNHIFDTSITTDKLATGSVTNDKIKNYTITQDKLAFNLQKGSDPFFHYWNGSKQYQIDHNDYVAATVVTNTSLKFVLAGPWTGCANILIRNDDLEHHLNSLSFKVDSLPNATQLHWLISKNGVGILHKQTVVNNEINFTLQELIDNFGYSSSSNQVINIEIKGMGGAVISGIGQIIQINFTPYPSVSE